MILVPNKLAFSILMPKTRRYIIQHAFFRNILLSKKHYCCNMS